MPRGAAPGERRGGRAKGTRNKKNAEQVEAIAASGMTPLEFLLSVMRDEKAPVDRRLDAAGKAAPYVHAKLSSIEAKIEGGFSGYQATPIPVEQRESIPVEVRHSDQQSKNGASIKAG